MSNQIEAPTFMIRNADNIYDLCHNNKRKAVFLIANQMESPIIYWSGRNEGCRAFIATKIKECLDLFVKSYTGNLSGESVTYNCKPVLKDMHDEIFEKLEDGEKGVFSIFISEAQDCFGYYLNCADAFSFEAIKITLERFIKDAEL